MFNIKNVKCKLVVCVLYIEHNGATRGTSDSLFGLIEDRCNSISRRWNAHMLPIATEPDLSIRAITSITSTRQGTP